MSLVGTRPPTVDEWDKYELHHRARLATKPGLTGMWQVSGRSNITDFEEVVKLDKQYISEWTIAIPVSIQVPRVLVILLQQISGDEEKIEDAFYKDLAFGTGGLRGVIGAGTNRLNVYTVAKASQGLADYVIKNFAPEKRKIAVSFDSRIKSDVFAKVASGVFAANGIKVEIYSELMPTPCLSFAVRYLGCAAGVMVTASHNPAKYNGYKVYGADGCQITTEAAAEILAEIEKLDIFDDVKRISFEEGFEAGKISYISEEVYTAFVEAVKKESVLGDTQVNKDVAIVYAEYGYCLNTLHSYTFEGSAGFEKMQNIMVSFRKSITEFAGKKVLKCLDYLKRQQDYRFDIN